MQPQGCEGLGKVTKRGLTRAVSPLLSYRALAVASPTPKPHTHAGRGTGATTKLEAAAASSPRPLPALTSPRSVLSVGEELPAIPEDVPHKAAGVRPVDRARRASYTTVVKPFKLATDARARAHQTEGADGAGLLAAATVQTTYSGSGATAPRSPAGGKVAAESHKASDMLRTKALAAWKKHVAMPAATGGESVGAALAGAGPGVLEVPIAAKQVTGGKMVTAPRSPALATKLRSQHRSSSVGPVERSAAQR